VIDATAANIGSTLIYQGVISSRPATPEQNSIYFSTDTGEIYTENLGAWELFNGQIYGDATKPAHSKIITLNTVNSTPGSYGNSSHIPTVTVNGKGLVTGVVTTPITFPEANIGGKIGDVIFQKEASGGYGTNSNISFDSNSSVLTIGNQIAFDIPILTFNNLSPLSNVGDILVRTALTNDRLPVGTDGQVLTADSASAAGVKWAAGGGGNTAPSTVQVVFNYGDASPKFLCNVAPNKMVLNSSIVIQTAFNGTDANLRIGSSGSPSDIMGADENLPSITSTWSNAPTTFYANTTAVYLSINAGSGATTGSGLVVLNIQS
jgi:hypothetical protein